MSSVSPISSGDVIHITNQTWQVTIPADLAGLLGGLLGTSFSVSSVVKLSGTNTAEGVSASAASTNTITLGGAGPLVVSFNAPDISFHALGGDAAIALKGATTSVEVPGVGPAGLTCTAAAGAALLTVKVNGAVIPTTTIVGSGGPTTTHAVGGGGGGGTLVVTGGSLRTFWTEILGGLLIIQIGVLFYGMTGMGLKRRRRA